MAVDPITTEIIRKALNAAPDDVNATLVRSSYNWIIYESQDCSVGDLVRCPSGGGGGHGEPEA